MLAVFSASPAFAVPTLRTVTNINDSGAGSLRQAITDADSSNTGDTIVFQGGVTGTITLTSGNLEITNSLDISGPGASTLAISGGGISRVFIVDPGATVSISGLTVEAGNSSPSGTSDGDGGGGIFNMGTLTLTNSTVFDNFSSNGGGGIENLGTMTLTDSTVSVNSSFGTIFKSSGGGIANFGTLTLTNSTVSGNSANGDGGGIYNVGTLTLTNSTVSGNSASANLPATSANGGGIANLGTQMMTLTNITISGNSASSFGGGIYSINGTMTLRNTIVANTPSAGNCDNAGGTFTSDGHNLSDDMTCNSLLIGTGDLNDTPAGLDSGGLNNNGGPTQTIALLAGSAAVDAIPVGPKINFCTATDGTTPIATARGDAPSRRCLRHRSF